MKLLNNSENKIPAVGSVAKRVVFVLALSAALPMQADESALYDEAPEGSAYIRLINLAASAIEVEIGNKLLSVEEYCQASAYVYLPPGEYTIDNQSVNWNSQLAPNQAYSLIVKIKGARLEPEQRFSSARKGLLAVYNFLPDVISIRTTQGDDPVLGEIASSSQNSIKVNTIKIQLSVHVKNKGAMDLVPIIFQTGVVSSLLVCRDGVGIVAYWSNN